MFDHALPETAAADLAATLVAGVHAVVEAVRSRATQHGADAIELGAAEVDLVTACEEVVRIAQGTQLEAVQMLDERRRRVMDDRVDETVLTRSLFAEIALARRVSTPSGETTYALARALAVHPRTHDLLRDGTISQGVAAAVCRETTFASLDDRRLIDAQLAPVLPELSPRRAAQEARRLVLASDPHAAYERVVRARAERAVSLRPELDAMATMTVYAPAEQLVSAFERLDRDASARRADGDPRTIRQITADLAVEALTGVGVKQDGWAHLGVEVGVVMTADTLFTSADAPATLTGYGPVPAELARRLASSEHAWVRRFFTAPDGETLTGSDPRARRFTAAVRRLVQVVDGQCRRPWCDCRIRDIDHVVPYARGGSTSASNAQGACQSDNLVKELPGWAVTGRASPDRTLPSEVRWRTPTGHLHTSRRRGAARVPPPASRGGEGEPESAMESATRSAMESRFAALLSA
ncbi:HNH endonuclease [Mumia sp. zg.B53]|uniref:HNH endonuclease n=1 Tax=Mumia sp. zg.B53 TaxID=2855449 RepID=UPI001C6E6996|nr:HNH endonuclease [Mumia sp. zg.B53]MBW9216828.1 HNH endonuclease [Mumia sp. zg.B53]